jgi:small multidrug resistance pump
MGYIFLGGAIAVEVLATLCLRASEGFTRPLYGVVVVFGYCAAFVLLSLALQDGLKLGICYGIWAAVGVAAVSILSVPLFDESISALQGVGLLLVILGVFALEAGAGH